MTVFATFVETNKPVCKLTDLLREMTGNRSEFVTNAYEDTANVAKYERLLNIFIRKHILSNIIRKSVKQHWEALFNFSESCEDSHSP